MWRLMDTKKPTSAAEYIVIVYAQNLTHTQTVNTHEQLFYCKNIQYTEYMLAHKFVYSVVFCVRFWINNTKKIQFHAPKAYCTFD